MLRSAPCGTSRSTARAVLPHARSSHRLARPHRRADPLEPDITHAARTREPRLHAARYTNR